MTAERASYVSDPVSGDEAQLGAVFEEDVTCGLLGVDTDAVVSDDGAGSRGDSKLFGGKLENRCKRRGLGHIDNLVRQFRVRREGDLEADLGRVG